MKKVTNFTILCCILVLIGITFSTRTLAQEETDLPDELGLALGMYKIRFFVELPKEFQDFAYIQFDHLPDEDMKNPRMDKDGRVKVIGWFGTTGKTTYEFKEGYLKKTANDEFEKMNFKSVEIDTISYAFCGKFLKNKIWERGSYTEIRGTLTKYKNGKKIASKEFPFSEYVDEDF